MLLFSIRILGASEPAYLLKSKMKNEISKFSFLREIKNVSKAVVWDSVFPFLQCLETSW